jgi:hypothetical protein
MTDNIIATERKTNDRQYNSHRKKPLNWPKILNKDKKQTNESNELYISLNIHV